MWGAPMTPDGLAIVLHFADTAIELRPRDGQIREIALRLIDGAERSEGVSLLRFIDERIAGVRAIEVRDAVGRSILVGREG